jgi:hypothetical protein
MGACASGGSMTEDDKTARKKNTEIEYELQHDRKRLKEEVKLLLLGTSHLLPNIGYVDPTDVVFALLC